MSEKIDGHRVVKSGLWYTIANISIRAVAIITTPIYTSMLTTADYGRANTFNTWIDLFNIFTCLCVVYSIGRAKLDFGDKFDEFLSALQGLSSTFGFAVLIFATIFREQISAAIKYEVPLVITLFVYLCISPSVEYMMQRCRYLYKYKENIVISLITCIGQIALSITLMLLFNDKRYFGKILGVLLPTFLMGVCFYVRFLVKGKCFYKKEYWIYALKIGLPMIPHALSLMVLSQVDRLMIKDILGDEQSGLYIFGYSFASLLMIFTNAIGQAWLPWFNDQLNVEKRESIRNIQKKLVLLGIALSIAFIAVAPEALMILSPSAPAYWEAKYVVPPIVLGTLAQYYYTNYVNVEIFYKKTVIIAVNSSIAAVLNYFLNAWAIPKWGYTAAAYTTLASYVILMLLHYVAVRFILKEMVYDSRFMFVTLLLTTCIGLAFMIVYPQNAVCIAIRYAAFVLLAAIFAYLNRNDIMALIAYIKEHYLHKKQSA